MTPPFGRERPGAGVAPSRGLGSREHNDLAAPAGGGVVLCGMRAITLLVLGTAAGLGAQQPTTHLSGTVLATWSGGFDFPAVASGRAKLEVAYAGRTGAARDILLPAGKSLRLEVLVDSAATDLDPFITEGSPL